MNTERPPVFLISLVGFSFAAFAAAYGEPFLPLVCGAAVFFARRTSLELEGPSLKRPVRSLAMIGGLIAFGVAYTYFFHWTKEPFGSVARGIIGLPATAWAWYLPGKAAKKTWACFFTTAMIALSAAAARQPVMPTLVGPLLVGYGACLFWGLSFPTGKPIPPSSRREARRLFVVVSTVFLFVGGGTVVGSYTVFEASRNILQVFSLAGDGWMPAFADRMGAVGDLSMPRSGRIDLEDDVAFTVSGSNRGGYFRMQTFSRYSQTSWKVDSSGTIDLALQTDPVTGATFRMVGSDGPELGGESVQVTLFSGFRGNLPLPYDCAEVKFDEAVRLSRRGDGTLVAAGPRPPERFRFRRRVASGRERIVGAGNHIDAALEVSPEVKRVLEPVLLELTAGRRLSPLETAAEVESWFQRNFHYSLEVRLAREGDPTVDLVVNRKPGYCKYFASGMVLLLRSGGVPARVAGGYRSLEYDPHAGELVVRRRHAHTWCEVHDSETGDWVRFDPTPDAALDFGEPTGLAASLRRRIAERTARVLCSISNITLETLPLRIWEPLKAGARNPAAVLILVGVAVLIFRSRLKKLGFHWFRNRLAVFRNFGRDARTDVNAGASGLLDRVLTACEGITGRIRESETLDEFVERMSRALDDRGVPVSHTVSESLFSFMTAYQSFRFGSPSSSSLSDLASTAIRAIENARAAFGKTGP